VHPLLLSTTLLERCTPCCTEWRGYSRPHTVQSTQLLPAVMRMRDFSRVLLHCRENTHRSRLRCIAHARSTACLGSTSSPIRHTRLTDILEEEVSRCEIAAKPPPELESQY